MFSLDHIHFREKKWSYFFGVLLAICLPRIRIKKLVKATNIQNIVEEIGRIKFQNVESRTAPHEN